uniref:N-acetylglucosaminylphosphatidylinositol deacetylase n=1 Tax=Macrostomum lignano TaxID=282301 RepID=A0A1I8HSS1_9PLAT
FQSQLPSSAGDSPTQPSHLTLSILLISLTVLIVAVYLIACRLSNNCLLRLGNQLIGLRDPSAATSEQSPLRLLLVTAHPDDECMFFAPLLLALSAQSESPSNHRWELYLACLSTGNYYGLGDIRVSELTLAWTKGFGQSVNRLRIVNDSRLPDSNSVDWQAAHIDDCVSGLIDEWQIDCLATFDSGGVSGHANHRALQRWALSRCASHRLRRDRPVPVLLLRTVGLARKYSGVLAILPALLEHSLSHSDPSPATALFVTLPSRLLTPLHCMRRHLSQLVWFRYLYCLFSSYLLINTPSNHGDKATRKAAHEAFVSGHGGCSLVEIWLHLTLPCLLLALTAQLRCCCHGNSRLLRLIGWLEAGLLCCSAVLQLTVLADHVTELVCAAATCLLLLLPFAQRNNFDFVVKPPQPRPLFKEF